MKKINSLIFITFLIFFFASCINTPPNIKLPNSNTLSRKKEKLFDYKKVIEFVKNKEKYKGDIKIKIQSNYSNEKVFSIKSTPIINKDLDKINSHQTHKKHLQENDINIFNISNPNELNNLIAYLGSESEKDKKLSSININNEDQTFFETGIIVAEFKSEEGLNKFKSIYNAEVLDSLNNFYKLKVDLKTSPITNIENLIREYNNHIPVDIKDITFSSISSMQTFIVILDFVINHSDLVNEIVLNLFQETPFTPNDHETWSGALGGWALEKTRTLGAWDYSIGTGVKVGWIDTYYSNIDTHPEIVRRVKFTSFPQNDKNLINDINFCIFNCEDIQRYHGHYSLMSGFAERNNDIKTAGPAPNSIIYPYSGVTPWDIAKAVNHAVNINKVDIIGINQNFRIDAVFSSFVINPMNSSLVKALFGVGDLENEIRAATQQINNITVTVAAHNYARPLKNTVLGILTEYWFPSIMSEVITVGSVTYDDKNKKFIVNFDSGKKNDEHGKGSNFGLSDMVWAPGNAVDVSRHDTPNTHKSIGGTSFAHPFVTGVVALMKSRNKDLTPEQVKNILISTSNNYGHDVTGHAYMGYKQVKMIDTLSAVEKSIKERNDNKDPYYYLANLPKKVGYFDYDNKKIKFNNGEEYNYIDSISKVEYENEVIYYDSNAYQRKNLVTYSGWFYPNPPNNSLKDFEILYLKRFNTPPEITGINTNSFTNGVNIEITGSNLYGPNGDSKISFVDITDNNKEYIYNVENNTTHFKDNNGNKVTFIFNKDKIKDSSGNQIPITDKQNKHKYNIIFEGTNGRSQSFNNNFSIGFSVSGLNLKPGGITIKNHYGDDIKTLPIYEPLKVEAGEIIGVGIEGVNNLDINAITITINGQKVTLNEIVEDYILFGVPENLPLGIQDVIISYVTSDENSSITLSDALEILSQQINNDNWTLKFFNVDDTAVAELEKNNTGNSLLAAYTGEVKEKNISNLLPYGDSLINFDFYNTGGGGYTWGVELRKGNQLILRDVRGRYGYFGAHNNDQNTYNSSPAFSTDIMVNREKGLLVPSADWRIKLTNTSPGDTLNVYRNNNGSWQKIASKTSSTGLDLFRLSPYFNLAKERLKFEVVNPSGSYSYAFALLRDSEEVYRNSAGDQYYGASPKYPYNENYQGTGSFNIKQTTNNTIDIETSLEIGFDGGLPTYLSPAPFPNTIISFIGNISLDRNKFIDDEPFTEPIETVPNDILGVALDGINASDISITVDGKPALIKDIVNEYIAFQIPSNVTKGVKDVVISDSNKTLTFKQALEIIEIVQAPVNISNSNASDKYAKFSPDQSKILFLRGDYPYSQVYIMDNNGSNQKNLTNNPNLHHSSNFFIPDGSGITYSISNPIWNVWKMNLDGNNKTQLTFHSGSGGYAGGSYSPDGSNKLLIQGTFPGAYWSTYLMNGNYPNITTLAQSNNGYNYGAKWSPDGSKIVYLKTVNGYDQIMTMNSDGNNKKQLTNFNFTHYEAVWNGDGTKIYYTTNETGKYQIYRMNPDGTGRERVHISNSDDIINWVSPDNSKILFHSNRTGKNQIYIMNNVVF